jgi:hypothetical protein
MSKNRDTIPAKITKINVLCGIRLWAAIIIYVAFLLNLAQDRSSCSTAICNMDIFHIFILSVTVIIFFFDYFLYLPCKAGTISIKRLFSLTILWIIFCCMIIFSTSTSFWPWNYPTPVINAFLSYPLYIISENTYAAYQGIRKKVFNYWDMARMLIVPVGCIFLLTLASAYSKDIALNTSITPVQEFMDRIAAGFSLIVGNSIIQWQQNMVYLTSLNLLYILWFISQAIGDYQLIGRRPFFIKKYLK